MVNEVAPRPHNSGHYTIEAVPYMSQYKAQLHAVLDLPVPQDLVPRVSSAIMINILGGADASSHHKLSKLARTTFDGLMDVYLHLYGKEPKPGRKIGHITLTGFCPIQELEMHAQPFLNLADQIREERISKVTEQLRPQEEAKNQDVNEDDVEESGEASTSTPVPINGERLANGSTPSDVPAATKVKPAPQKPVVQRKPSKKGKEVATRAAQLKRTQSQTQTASGTPSGPLVLVTMGSDSDLPVLKAGLDILEEFKVPYVTRITSAHRTAKLMMRVAEEAASQGFKAIIAAAGGAAHLPGMIASETPLPVIGVPVKASQLDGVDSLYSIVQMPVSLRDLQYEKRIMLMMVSSVAVPPQQSESTTRPTPPYWRLGYLELLSRSTKRR
jgi:phosphoribosylaminoimidazole carboxylase